MSGVLQQPQSHSFSWGRLNLLLEHMHCSSTGSSSCSDKCCQQVTLLHALPENKLEHRLEQWPATVAELQDENICLESQDAILNVG